MSTGNGVERWLASQRVIDEVDDIEEAIQHQSSALQDSLRENGLQQEGAKCLAGLVCPDDLWDTLFTIGKYWVWDHESYYESPGGILYHCCIVAPHTGYQVRVGLRPHDQWDGYILQMKFDCDTHFVYRGQNEFGVGSGDNRGDGGGDDCGRFGSAGASEPMDKN